MSGDAEQGYFADGITDDLMTELSQVPGLFVVSRNSTFVYKGKIVRPGQVAEELGVRYVLEGSVQRAGDQLRINAQLIERVDGGHAWAERFDGSVATSSPCKTRSSTASPTPWQFAWLSPAPRLWWRAGRLTSPPTRNICRGGSCFGAIPLTLPRRRSSICRRPPQPTRTTARLTPPSRECIGAPLETSHGNAPWGYRRRNSMRDQCCTCRRQ